MNYFGTKTFRHIDKHCWLYAFAVIPFLVSIAYFFGEYLEENYPILGSFGIFVLMIVYLAWLISGRITALDMARFLKERDEALSDKSIEYIDAIIKKLDIKDFILLERKFLEYEKEQKEKRRLEALEEKEKLDKEYEAERVAKYQGYVKAELKERKEFLSIKEKIEKSVRE